jgi:hypothetical protein
MYAVQVLQAIRSGATDVMPRGAVASEVSEILSRVLNSALATQGRLGRLTLVLGTDRDATAMLATDMALAHSLDGPATLLIDCTLPSSTAEAYLDLKVDYGLAAAVTDLDRMDASLLNDALARHEASGLSLLTLDGGPVPSPWALVRRTLSGWYNSCGQAAPMSFSAAAACAMAGCCANWLRRRRVSKWSAASPSVNSTPAGACSTALRSTPPARSGCGCWSGIMIRASFSTEGAWPTRSTSTP